MPVFGLELERNLIFVEALVEEELVGRILERQQDRALNHHGPVLPRGAYVVLAHTHTRVDRHSLVRVGLRHIVKRDLAVVPHDDVGEPHEEREQLRGPERGIGRIRDVHVDLDDVLDPPVFKQKGLRLHELRVGNRLPQLLLDPGDRILPGLVLLRKVDPVMERVLQQVEP